MELRLKNIDLIKVPNSICKDNLLGNINPKGSGIYTWNYYNLSRSNKGHKQWHKLTEKTC